MRNTKRCFPIWRNSVTRDKRLTATSTIMKISWLGWKRMGGRTSNSTQGIWMAGAGNHWRETVLHPPFERKEWDQLLAGYSQLFGNWQSFYIRPAKWGCPFWRTSRLWYQWLPWPWLDYRQNPGNHQAQGPVPDVHECQFSENYGVAVLIWIDQRRHMLLCWVTGVLLTLNGYPAPQSIEGIAGLPIWDMDNPREPCSLCPSWYVQKRCETSDYVLRHWNQFVAVIHQPCEPCGKTQLCGSLAHYPPRTSRWWCRFLGGGIKNPAASNRVSNP